MAVVHRLCRPDFGDVALLGGSGLSSLLTLILPLSGGFFTKAARFIQEPLSPKLLPKALMFTQVIDMARKNAAASCVQAGRMYRFMVKIETAGIFKGIFEIQKSTRIEENLAEIRVFGT
jgi:hypothetical protein